MNHEARTNRGSRPRIDLLNGQIEASWIDKLVRVV